MMVWGFRIALLVALGLFISTQIDIAAVGQYFTSKLLVALIASQPAILLSFLLFSIRLRLIAPAPPPKLSTAFNAFVLPIGLNTVLPARLSELVKPAYLRWAEGLSLRSGFSILIVEKVFDILVIGAAALLVLPSAYLSSGIFLFLTALIVGAALLPWMVNVMLHFAPTSDSKITVFIRQLLEAVSQVSGRNRYLPVVVLTAGGWLASMLSIFVFLNVAGTLSVSFTQAGAVFVLTLIGGLVAVLPAGLGGFQAAALIGLLAIGYSEEESLVLAILLHVQALLFAGAYAAIFASFTDFRMSNLKNLTTQP